VADRLAAPGVRLLLTGGPGEAPLVAEVAALMGQPPLTLAGQTSVGQLAALLGRAALVMGVDSGPLHIAVSQGAPSLHLFGPSDWRRFGPWGEPARHVVLSAGLFCSPCGVFTACPRGTAGPECMAALSVDEVVAAAQALLRGEAPSLAQERGG
jgi:heptosyltransferase-2/heptosyltransferase-3